MAKAPDTVIATMPGLQAEFVAKALTLEGIVCLLECDGLRRLRHPDEEPTEPLAVTLPVSVYVASGQVTEAEAIMKSLMRDDVIGTQWVQPEGTLAGIPQRAEESAGPPEGEGYTLLNQVASNESPPRAEGTGVRFVVLLLAVGLLLFVFLGH